MTHSQHACHVTSDVCSDIQFSQICQHNTKHIIVHMEQKTSNADLRNTNFKQTCFAEICISQHKLVSN